MVNLIQAQKLDQFCFIWLSCINRFDLEYMQNRLSNIVQTSDADKTMVYFLKCKKLQKN